MAALAWVLPGLPDVRAFPVRGHCHPHHLPGAAQLLHANTSISEPPPLFLGRPFGRPGSCLWNLPASPFLHWLPRLCSQELIRWQGKLINVALSWWPESLQWLEPSGDGCFLLWGLHGGGRVCPSQDMDPLDSKTLHLLGLGTAQGTVRGGQGRELLLQGRKSNECGEGALILRKCHPQAR